MTMGDPVARLTRRRASCPSRRRPGAGSARRPAAGAPRASRTARWRGRRSLSSAARGRCGPRQAAAGGGGHAQAQRQAGAAETVNRACRGRRASTPPSPCRASPRKRATPPPTRLPAANTPISQRRSTPWSTAQPTVRRLPWAVARAGVTSAARLGASGVLPGAGVGGGGWDLGGAIPPSDDCGCGPGGSGCGPGESGAVLGCSCGGLCGTTTAKAASAPVPALPAASTCPDRDLVLAERESVEARRAQAGRPARAVERARERAAGLAREGDLGAGRGRLGGWRGEDGGRGRVDRDEASITAQESVQPPHRPPCGGREPRPAARPPQHRWHRWHRPTHRHSRRAGDALTVAIARASRPRPTVATGATSGRADHEPPSDPPVHTASTALTFCRSCSGDLDLRQRRLHRHPPAGRRRRDKGAGHGHPHARSHTSVHEQRVVRENHPRTEALVSDPAPGW